MWPFNMFGGSGSGSSKRSVSLSGQIASFGDLEEILEMAVAGYRATLESVVNHTPRLGSGAKLGAEGAASRHPSGDFKKNLRQLRARLEGQQPTAALLKETTRDVERELANWGRSTEAIFDAQEKETKDAMAAVAVMAEVLGQHEKTYGVRFRGISKKLRLLTTSTDISEIRKKLQGEIELLEQYVEQMTKESDSALGRLRQIEDARRIRSRVETEMLVAAAGCDRDRISEAVRAQVKTGDRVAVVRLMTTTAIALKGNALVVSRLADVFEAPAMTGQWGEDCFVAITRLALPEAAARLEIVERDLSQKLGGKLEGTVFEKTPGTTPAELLARFETASPKAAA